MRDVDQHLLARQVAIARKALPSCYWAQIANQIAAERQKTQQHLRKPDDQINKTLFNTLEDLNNKAVAVLPARLDQARIAEVREYLAPLPVYRGSHIYSSDHRLHPFADVQRDAPFAGYLADQVLRAPHLVDLFNEPAIIDFLEAALGCVPTLYSVNAWWSFPRSTATGLNAQHFHRDTDDWRFFTLFLYLTDVDENAGPHQIVAGSHTLQGTTALIERSAEKIDPVGSFTERNFFNPALTAYVERYFQDSILSVMGPAGTIFVANTLALHRGLVPIRTPRLIVWARYGLGPNTNSMDLEQGPIDRIQVPTSLADTPRDRYINRILIDYDRMYGLRA